MTWLCLTPVEENSQNLPVLERWAAPAMLLAAVDVKRDYHLDHLAVSTPVEENIHEHDLTDPYKTCKSSHSIHSSYL